MPLKIRQGNREGFYCPECDALLSREPANGAVYFCPDCAKWFCQPRDKAAEKVLTKVKEETAKVERKGPLPAAALKKTRELVKADCVNYEAEFQGIRNYCSREPKSTDHRCIFFVDCSVDAVPHRCRWFEQCVLPGHFLEKAYCRIYDADVDAKKMDQAVKETLRRAREKAMKPCARCGKKFLPRSNFNRYCSDACRRAARREANQESRERIKSQGSRGVK